MTRLERKEAELEKLYQYRAAAIRQNNLYWLSMNAEKIDALEKEVIELKQNQSKTVFSVMADKGEKDKDRVYKALLRIHLMADATNEACEVAKSILKEYGVTDFSFRKKVDELCKLSQEIASITIRANNKDMEDFIVDDDTFVDMCMKHADAHIKRKLKL